MEYLGHYDAETKKKQRLKDHLEDVAGLSARFAKAFDAEKLGEIAGRYHDIGKYSDAFQAYLLGERNSGGDHSTAGAQILFQTRQPVLCLLAEAIAGHHGGMPDFGTTMDDAGGTSFLSRMRKDLPFSGNWRKEEPVPPSPECQLPLFKPPVDFYRIQFFTRMMFSCLVDADFLDTEAFYQSCLPEAKQTAGDRYRHGFDSLVLLKDNFDEMLKTQFFNINGERYHEIINVHRREILRECLREGDEGTERLYRMTVPTGGGKTIASLGFALHRAARAGSKIQRIIYVIPYTSIIEQNARVFQCFLGKKNVVVHYANAAYDDVNEDGRRQRLATENWDAPLIVTTNVQFFESLYANRTSKCRKLHNIANSLIIFDEAQMIPLAFLKPCVEAIRTLVEYYGCMVVLCTATQPALEPFLGGAIKELCPAPEKQFAFFSRVTFAVRETRYSPQSLADEIGQKKEVLVVVNSKKSARELYEAMPDKEGVFHLSTNLCAVHRMKLLDEIRERLKKELTCRVISTSLIEAGVDLDFPTVYRELTGLDSILQAAGRCNREGKRAREESIVTIFRFENSRMPTTLQRQGMVAEKILANYAEKLSSPEAVEAYFKELYGVSGEKMLDQHEILELCRTKMLPMKEIAERFQLIDDESQAVFISYDEEAARILELLRTRPDGGGRELLRRAGAYTVNVRRDSFERMIAAGKIAPLWEDSLAMYVLVDETLYDKETLGLQQVIPDGQAVFG